MSADIINFPGFVVLEDRKTIFKSGKRYKSTDELIADLPHQDRKNTFDWICTRYSYGNPPWVVAKLDFRARKFRKALYGDGSGCQQGGAASMILTLPLRSSGPCADASRARNLRRRSLSPS